MSFGYQSPIKNLLSGSLAAKGRAKGQFQPGIPKTQPISKTSQKESISMRSEFGSLNQHVKNPDETKPVATQPIMSPKAAKTLPKPKITTMTQTPKLADPRIYGVGRFSPRGGDAIKMSSPPQLSQPPIYHQQQISLEEISLNGSAESIKGHTLFHDESLDNARLLLETICESDSKKTTYSRSPSVLTPNVARIQTSHSHMRLQQHSHSPNPRGTRYLVNTEYDEPQDRVRINHTSDKRTRRQVLRDKEALSLQNSQNSLISSVKEPGNDFIFSRKVSQSRLGLKSPTDKEKISKNLETDRFAEKPTQGKLKMIQPMNPPVSTQVQQLSNLLQTYPVMSPIWYSATGSQVVERHSLQVPIWQSLQENIHSGQQANFMTAEQLLPERFNPAFAVSAPRQETQTKSVNRKRLEYQRGSLISEQNHSTSKQPKQDKISDAKMKITSGSEPNSLQPNRKISQPAVKPQPIYPTSKHSTHDLVNMLLKNTSHSAQIGSSSITSSQIAHTLEKAKHSEIQKVPQNTVQKAELPERVSALVSQPPKTDKYFEFYDFGVKKEIKRINHDVDSLIRRASEPTENAQTYSSSLSLQQVAAEQSSATPQLLESPSKPLAASVISQSKPVQSKKNSAAKLATTTASEYFDARKYLAARTTAFGIKPSTASKFGVSLVSGLQNNTSKTSMLSANQSAKSSTTGISNRGQNQPGSTKVLADKFLSKLIKKYEKKPEEQTSDNNKQQSKKTTDGALSLQSLLKNLIHTSSYTQNTNTPGFNNQSGSNPKMNFTRDHSLSSNVSSMKSLSTSMRAGSAAKRTISKKPIISTKYDENLVKNK